MTPWGSENAGTWHSTHKNNGAGGESITVPRKPRDTISIRRALRGSSALSDKIADVDFGFNVGLETSLAIFSVSIGTGI
jgi:hypothetical protein